MTMGKVKENLNVSAGEALKEAALPDSQNAEASCSVQAANEPAEGMELSRSGEISVLRLSGAIDISSAAELKAMLLKAFEGSKQVQVSTEGVSDLDVTALQLLWAARKHAAKLGVGFAINAAPAGALGNLVAELGMEKLGIFA